MKPRLSKAAISLREAIDDAYPDRSRVSDGWLGDARHSLSGSASHHNPDAEGWVRAIDVTAKLCDNSEEMHYLCDQLRKTARKDRRLEYIIYDRKIASSIRNWRWRKYSGINPHTKHAHFSFKESANEITKPWKIPMLDGDNNEIN